MSGYIGIRKVPTKTDAGGIWGLREQAKFQKDGIWPFTDLYWDNVSLLMHFDGANNSTTFTDVSKNSHTITRNGDAKISTTQSKFGGSSGYFDGSGDFLKLNGHASLGYGAGDFTFECWIYPLSVANFDITDNHPQGVSTGAYSNLYVHNGYLKHWSNGVESFVSSTASVTANNWHHIAYCRVGSVIYFYVNGVSVGSYTDTTTFIVGSSRPIIGSDAAENTWFLNGYIDELRITKGVARYTGNFTPPTAPFPDNS